LIVQGSQGAVESVSRANIDILDVKTSCFGNMHDHRLTILHIVHIVLISHLAMVCSPVGDHLNFIVGGLLGKVVLAI
jgi:hypothetical protein